MSLVCWKCGASLAAASLPFSRQARCPSCATDLHACRLCRHFDAHRAGQCREFAAPRIADKLHANTCGWFVPRPEAYRGGGAIMAQASRSALDVMLRNHSGISPPGDSAPPGSSAARAGAAKDRK